MSNETILLEAEKNEILENFKKTNPLIFNHIKECCAYFENVLPVTVAVSIKEDGTGGQ
jgi:transcriptional antiterminator